MKAMRVWWQPVALYFAAVWSGNLYSDHRVLSTVFGIVAGVMVAVIAMSIQQAARREIGG